MVEVCRRAIGSQANIKKISLGSLLGLLARHHDLGADVHAPEQVSDVLVEHANAAIRGKLADRLRPVSAMDGSAMDGEASAAKSNKLEIQPAWLRLGSGEQRPASKPRYACRVQFRLTD
jgi:hypothetical protein